MLPTTELTLLRLHTSDQGTLGDLRDDDGNHLFYTIELPWRDNSRGVSCVPLGEYLCTWGRSPRFGMVYTVNDVENRSNILIHSGNLAGDRAKGFTTHSEGCILIGNYQGKINGQLAVLSSRPALAKFHRLMSHTPFTLRIDA